MQAPPKVYKYVNEIGEDGWVQGLLNGSRNLIPLCKYTKVLMMDTKDGRTQFKVVDGTHAGSVLSMKTENATKYLGSSAPAQGGIEVNVTYGKYQEGWWSDARSQKLDQ